MKLKIRKVEVTPKEFLDALTGILQVDESIPQEMYLGSGLSYICKSLGLKELEFWKFKLDNKIEFDKQFELREVGKNSGYFRIYRKELENKINNILENKTNEY